MAQHKERIAASPGSQLARVLVPDIALPLLLCAGLLAWMAMIVLPNNPSSPPAALPVLAIVTLATAFLMRSLRARFGLDVRAALVLPDPLYMLYLATAILVGMRPAVALAILASLLMALPDMATDERHWATALRQAAAAGATTLMAAVIYQWLSHALAPGIRPIHAHLVGALIASLVMLAGAGAIRTLERQSGPILSLTTWRANLANPALRFQALMLAIGPLLPLADVLDDVEAELAWVLFLVPLFAMYYLALISIRLEQRKAELQRTIEELRISRRREAELADYAALITHAQEEERRRLARELHDDTAQALVALSRGLDSFSSETSGRERSARDARFVEDLSDLAKRSLESIRRACQDLRPSVLDDLGLAPALESLAGATTQRGLTCEFAAQGECRPCAPEVEMTIYRIAQEALSNSRRHAQATHAEIALTYRPDAIYLYVRDNGRGFDFANELRNAHHSATEPEARSGLGLLGMRERAALVGANLEVSSHPGAGTHVTLIVPRAGE